MSHFEHREFKLKWNEHNTAKAYILTILFFRKMWYTGRRGATHCPWILEHYQDTPMALFIWRDFRIAKKRGGKVQQDYIHEVPIIFHDNLQRESCKRYDPTTSVTWRQLLRMHMNTTSTAPNAEIQDLCTLPTWDISLGSLTLPAPEAGNFVELLLLKREHFRTGSTLNETVAIDPRGKWVLVTTEWRDLRFRMEEPPPEWRAAANILNRQSRTADKAWSSSLGVGRGANNSSP